MIFFAAILLLWLLGFLFLFRVPLCRGTGTGGEKVSVIIPARNEEAGLPGLLESLARQDPGPEEVIVVDDGSEDATAERAAQAGAKVLPSRPLPEGWRGKTWACWQGAEASRGEVLLCLAAVHALPYGNRYVAHLAALPAVTFEYRWWHRQSRGCIALAEKQHAFAVRGGFDELAGGKPHPGAVDILSDDNERVPGTGCCSHDSSPGCCRRCGPMCRIFSRSTSVSVAAVLLPSPSRML